jgi:hypothetical protein
MQICSARVVYSCIPVQQKDGHWKITCDFFFFIFLVYSCPPYPGAHV